MPMDEIAAARDAVDRFTATYGGEPPPVDVDELAASLCCLRTADPARLAAAGLLAVVVPRQ
jgi:hypothetical protein